MNDLSVIDHFLDVFSRYIDSGFGLLHGEVAFLTATLVVIDMTLAGLFWAMGGEEVIGKLIKKTLYVGAFAFIIGNFQKSGRHSVRLLCRARAGGVGFHTDASAVSAAWSTGQGRRRCSAAHHGADQRHDRLPGSVRAP